MIRRWLDFLSRDLWRIRLHGRPWMVSFWLNQLRIVVLAFRGFSQDKCRLRASALTLYLLMSLVPMVAVIFGVARGFGIEKEVEKRVMASFKGEVQVSAFATEFNMTEPADPAAESSPEKNQTPDNSAAPNTAVDTAPALNVEDTEESAELITQRTANEQIAIRVIKFANSLLDNTSGGLIAGLGVAVLFLTIIKMLSNIEDAFNNIWGIKKSRTLARKFSDYLAVILVCPIFLVVSGSLTVFINTQAGNALERFDYLQSFGPALHWLIGMSPYCILWIIFAFIYLFIPNTKVRPGSALLAGVVAGTMFQLAQWAYVTFQVGVAKYNAIYGSFAAIPLFLMWLQFSWLIVLFGAELAFAHQNVETYEFEPDCLELSNSFKSLLALLVLTRMVKRFCVGNTPWPAGEIAHELELPIRLVRQILFELNDADLISEVRLEDDRIPAFQPARDAETLSVQYVLDELGKRGSATLPVVECDNIKHLRQCLDHFAVATRDCPGNLLLKNI